MLQKKACKNSLFGYQPAEKIKAANEAIKILESDDIQISLPEKLKPIFNNGELKTIWSKFIEMYVRYSSQQTVLDPRSTNCSIQ